MPLSKNALTTTGGFFIGRREDRMIVNNTSDMCHYQFLTFAIMLDEPQFRVLSFARQLENGV
jgi:hypothetical protein